MLEESLPPKWGGESMLDDPPKLGSESMLEDPLPPKMNTEKTGCGKYNLCNTNQDRWTIEKLKAILCGMKTIRNPTLVF